jgi:phosphoglycolate phosphatase
MSSQAVIFDFDGTIADTFAAVIETLNELAPEFGYRTAAPAELPALRALGLRQLAEHMGLAWHKLPRLVSRVRTRMAHKMVEVAPCAGMPEALGALRERGLTLGVLTSNTRENVAAFLSAHPELHFDFVSTGSGLFSKHRRLARVLRRQALAADRACYVGDEVRDIEAARALDMRVIAVGWGYAAPQLLAASRPDHLILEPGELLALV